jgi:SsrA-binding protein
VNTDKHVKIISTNRKVGFEYFLFDRYEAGLALQGSEIKSIRAGQVSLSESYISVDERNAWLVEAHIAPYEQANRFNHDPKRPRRLLLHKRERKEIWESIRQKGMTVVPIRLYLSGGRAKIEIAVARGKKIRDKRTEIAKRDAERSAEREMRVR